MAAPKTANISVKIGTKDISVTHRNFSSINIKRLAHDVSDKFTMSVMDDDAFTIEKELLLGNSDIEVSYIDNELKVYKKFSGYVISMSVSFIDNRCMLTLDGYIGIKAKDKYNKISCSWNIVPKFKWEDVLSKDKELKEKATYYTDNMIDKFKQGWDQEMYDPIGDFWNSLKFFGRLITGQDTSNKDWNYKEVFDKIFEKDWISMDKDGNYYIKKFKSDMTESDFNADLANMTEDERQNNIVKSEGNYVIPVKPDKVIKLICCGGSFSELLEDKYENYAGTAFYNDDISMPEWYFIKKWFEKMGKIDGIGYTSIQSNSPVDFIEDPINQQRQSVTDYIFDTVLPKCKYTHGKVYTKRTTGENVETHSYTTQAKQYGVKVQEEIYEEGKVYSNFYVTFSSETGLVVFDRLKISNDSEPKAKYIYYGKFTEDDSQNGRLISFSPRLDILTTLISKGLISNNNADISDTNLITGEHGEEVTVSAESKMANEGQYAVKWGAVYVKPSITNTANKTNEKIELSKIFNDAATYPYKAEATISGFNKLEPQDYIEIIVIPKEYNNVGNIQHHTTGRYYVLGIEDNIEGGRYTSKLDLIKNVGNIGLSADTYSTSSDLAGELKYNVKP